jgi:hypothetical protein
MATEEDKTNTGIAGTAIAVGVAAMIAGSAALVSMARAEMDDQSEQTQGYADLSSINSLKAEQAQKLSSAKLSIEKARASMLSALKQDPEQASPWTPKAPPPEASSAATESSAPASSDTGAAASASSSGGAPSGDVGQAEPVSSTTNTLGAGSAPAASTAVPEEAPHPH